MEIYSEWKKNLPHNAADLRIKCRKCGSRNTHGEYKYRLPRKTPWFKIMFSVWAGGKWSLASDDRVLTLMNVCSNCGHVDRMDNAMSDDYWGQYHEVAEAKRAEQAKQKLEEEREARMRDAKCPRCDALIRVDSGEPNCDCEYCGGLIFPQQAIAYLKGKELK